MTWRSRAEVVEKHPKTAEHFTLNINSSVCPARCPFFTQTQDTRVDFPLPGRINEGRSWELVVDLRAKYDPRPSRGRGRAAGAAGLT